jgi:hypothetical protein
MKLDSGNTNSGKGGCGCQQKRRGLAEDASNSDAVTKEEQSNL